MTTNTIYECPLFAIRVFDGNIQCTFNTVVNTNTFMLTELFSKLLNSFVPDADGVWRPGDRSNFTIVGWPKHLSWIRTGETVVETPINSLEINDIYQYGEVLEKSLSGLVDRAESDDGGAYYNFSIADENSVYEYRFNDRARVIAALCVLYDLEPHDRNHLEVNIPAAYLKGLKWPLSQVNDETVVRHYGDPSKTADVLRNEGWTREGSEPGMLVMRNRIDGQQRQTYKLTTRQQSRVQQVKRTAIKGAWRQKLFAAQDYTCRICLNRYQDDPQQLSPDHRIPVIFEADNLSDDNFLHKLMTLCRYCNQQKREFCKRIDPDTYNWETSPWAYPEKYRLERLKVGIEEYADQNGLPAATVAAQLAEHFRTQP